MGNIYYTLKGIAAVENRLKQAVTKCEVLKKETRKLVNAAEVKREQLAKQEARVFSLRYRLKEAKKLCNETNGVSLSLKNFGEE